MGSGKAVLFAVWAICLAAGLCCRAGEFASDSRASPGGGARITIGGEVMTDIAHRSGRNTGAYDDGQLRRTNLRLVADVHPSVRAFFKLDFSDWDEDAGDSEILAEAMMVLSPFGGVGLDVFAGRGRVPYGQDITLGMIQSYHHSANHVDSPEGRIFIVDPPDGGLPPARPGQVDRATVAGAAYGWDERWRVEAAVFDPGDGLERFRPVGSPGRGGTRNDIGAAGRLWWRPVETLTLEGSVLNARLPGADGVWSPADSAPASSWSMSLGFDWRPGPWRVFGEFQQAWDWGLSRGYDVSVGQLGMSRDFPGGWRIGAMGEYMRAADSSGIDAYFKLTLNVRRMFAESAFVLFEYGHETMRRTEDGVLAGKRRGDFFGVRVGFMF